MFGKPYMAKYRHAIFVLCNDEKKGKCLGYGRVKCVILFAKLANSHMTRRKDIKCYFPNSNPENAQLG